MVERLVTLGLVMRKFHRTWDGSGVWELFAQNQHEAAQVLGRQWQHQSLMSPRLGFITMRVEFATSVMNLNTKDGLLRSCWEWDGTRGISCLHQEELHLLWPRWFRGISYGSSPQGFRVGHQGWEIWEGVGYQPQTLIPPFHIRISPIALINLEGRCTNWQIIWYTWQGMELKYLGKDVMLGYSLVGDKNIVQVNLQVVDV